MYYALTPNHPYWFAKDVERKKYICKWGERERERVGKYKHAQPM